MVPVLTAVDLSDSNVGSAIDTAIIRCGSRTDIDTGSQKAKRAWAGAVVNTVAATHLIGSNSGTDSSAHCTTAIRLSGRSRYGDY